MATTVTAASCRSLWMNSGVSRRMMMMMMQQQHLQPSWPLRKAGVSYSSSSSSCFVWAARTRSPGAAAAAVSTTATRSYYSYNCINSKSPYDGFAQHSQQRYSTAFGSSPWVSSSSLSSSSSSLMKMKSWDIQRMSINNHFVLTPKDTAAALDDNHCRQYHSLATYSRKRLLASSNWRLPLLDNHHRHNNNNNNNNNNNKNNHHWISRRWYTPMTPDEQDAEKRRVAQLSATEKETELRDLNRQLARLELLRGINTGELYTWTGKYKLLARNYGVPLMVYYGGVWFWMLVATYLVIDWGHVDVMALLFKLDHWTGYDISSQVRPEYGKLGLALVLNETLEVVRLPFVIVTVKPVMDRVFPTKY